MEYRTLKKKAQKKHIPSIIDFVNITSLFRHTSNLYGSLLQQALKHSMLKTKNQTTDLYSEGKE
jgi:hypothetical protein